MGEKLDKFLLLMWKNWVLQYRKPVQTIIEILAPVIFSVLLVLIRSLADPKLEQEKIYSPFCTIPFAINQITVNGNPLCPNVDNTMPISFNDSGQIITNITSQQNFTIVYSPQHSFVNEVMQFMQGFSQVVGTNNSRDLEAYTLNENATYIGIEFPDSLIGNYNISSVNDFTVSLRFPSETKFALDAIGNQNWKTNLIYPIFQFAGPRGPDYETGAAPSYFREGFLTVQHYLTVALILAQNHQTTASALTWLLSNNFPMIYMRRFPYAEWYSDPLLTSIQPMLGMIIMLSFVYTCINTVRCITTEKEKQLKESMKIMGLPNWLHWLAWFLKCFIFLLISIILMVVLLKVNWYPNSKYTVFTYTDVTVLLVFLILYACSVITFCFALSVFFSKANTASTIAGLAWFITYSPYLFMQNNYENLGLGTKLMSSLLPNSAMAFGFQVVLMYEGTGEGVSWNNLFKPNTPDDSLSLGLIWIMIVINTVMYLFIALYVEAVFPGEYGVPQPWYYLFTKTYWCGEQVTSDNSNGIQTFKSEFFEAEPSNLKPGIQIYNLRKVFNKKTAVRNLTLNMYEDQITVLLGHNGAGKTTTMSMLTGMITPTSGTASINGYDIKTNMAGVRNSLGLCPQHNIIFDELTVAEHLYFFSKLKGLTKKEIDAEIDKYVKLLDLEPKRNAKSATLSGGMKRKLCVGIALCGHSKVVMLDEPTAGMDPSARRVLWELLQKQKEGRTMLLTTHFMDEADLLGDRIGIMAGGELQCCGSSFFLKKKYGAGYSLIIDKTRDCEPHKITTLLSKYIPDIKIHTNVGTELTYLLTENYAPVFESLLNELETQSVPLGIQSYGISLTTLEEVFMKVGADHGQEEQYEEEDKKKKVEKVPTIMYDKNSVSLAPTYKGGTKLVQNQLLAMLLKKIVAILRSWLLLAIQIGLPMINIIIVMSIPNNYNSSAFLVSLPLNLDKFDNPVTVMENRNEIGGYSSKFEEVLKSYSLHSSLEENITDVLLSLTKSNPNTVRRRYLVGASFDSFSVEPNPTITIPTVFPNITAWFNNDAYHTPGISLSLILNSVYKNFLPAGTNGNIKFKNHPLPYTVETQINQLASGQSQGFQMAFNICFSMSFVASFYIIFLVRENVSKSKHLQFVSGVKVYIFWLVHALCDMTTYFITITVLIIAIACFQQDGFKTAEEIGILYLILTYFGCAALPLIYLVSPFFDVPSNGYTRMTMISIFLGSAAFLVVTILSSPGLNLENVGKVLHWIFLLYPHYSLATGINEYYTKYSYINVCNKYYKPFIQACLNMPDTTEASCAAQLGNQISSICLGLDENYFSWASPGIGRNLVYSFLSSICMYMLLLAKEYKLFSRFIYYIQQKLHPKYPIDIEDEDDDVAKEKQKIKEAAEFQLHSNYNLVIKDLTKYYKKILAVNGLSIGIGRGECFGLLGVNGAGKTTTFKMMSGDESISYGNGWFQECVKRGLGNTTGDVAVHFNQGTVTFTVSSIDTLVANMLNYNWNVDQARNLKTALIGFKPFG